MSTKLMNKFHLYIEYKLLVIYTMYKLDDKSLNNYLIIKSTKLVDRSRHIVHKLVDLSLHIYLNIMSTKLIDTSHSHLFILHFHCNIIQSNKTIWK